MPGMLKAPHSASQHPHSQELLQVMGSYFMADWRTEGPLKTKARVIISYGSVKALGNGSVAVASCRPYVCSSYDLKC